jgi:ribosomal protein S18 acetylase RimI-like enzyme
MNITKLGPDDQEAAVAILTRAFHDDPVLNWISADAGFTRRFFELTLPAFLPQGHTYMQADGMGAASWLDPASNLQWPFTPTNIWKAFKAGGAGGLFRFALSGRKTEKSHPGEAHYYLFAIGALPECQGQGVGTGLMSHMLRQCDQQQMPAYLENSKEANLPFYLGHGFQVLEQISFTKSAPPVWLMWRDPQPTA